MSEPHTADLGTRYRYRQEGAEAERERIIKLLEVEADKFDEMCWPMAGSPLRAMAQTLKGEQK